MSKDYYSLLGVSKNATDDEIKKAYRKLAHQHHPDKKGGDEAKFKEINAAYQILSNKEKRAQYDQFGSTFEDAAHGGAGGFNWQDFARQAGGANNSDYYRQGTGNFDFGDIGDIFGDIFGFNRKGRARKAKASDIEASLDIDFMEAVFGVEKFITLNKTVVCDRCTGSGAEPGAKIETCSTCGGSGQVQRVQNTFLGQMRSVGVCPECKGQGSVASKKCTKCKGLGVHKEDKEIKIKIPAGINDGQAIRLAGQGQAASGGEAGDLYIHININPNSYFHRDGFDIYTEEEITFSEAALGTTKEIKTVDGDVNLKIPAGTQSEKLLRLKGKGVPYINSKGRGNHFIKVIVKTPSKLSRKAKNIYEELAEEE